MSRDASLDDFLDDEGAPASNEHTGTEASVDEATEPATADDAPDADASTAAGPEPNSGATAGDSGLSTFDWSPDGAPCAGCGERVERRWRDDGRLVCEACKTW